MSAKDKYMQVLAKSRASHEGVLCETHEVDWRSWDYFADAATRVDIKKLNYYAWLRVTIDMGIKIARKRVHVILKAR